MTREEAVFFDLCSPPVRLVLYRPLDDPGCCLDTDLDMHAACLQQGRMSFLICIHILKQRTVQGLEATCLAAFGLRRRAHRWYLTVFSLFLKLWPEFNWIEISFLPPKYKNYSTATHLKGCSQTHLLSRVSNLSDLNNIVGFCKRINHELISNLQ